MVRKANVKDLDKIALLSQKVYSEPNIEVLKKEFLDYLQEENNLVLLSEINGESVGFAHITIRHDYVEGCDTFNVAYLEGIYVEKTFRGRGIAREFVNFAVDWAKKKGCNEFASDCQLTNSESIEFHKAIGFEEVGRIVCFKRTI
ncbi:MAG: GNAT family N-acetyltransferase [Clostridia bacterium]|nr:GNAT family N-acetyltransferase [Clostridia bacterium]